MPLSKTKLAKIRREQREDYVYTVSGTGNLKRPFLSNSSNDAALKYIETGDESLKSQFPSEPRRGPHARK